MTWACLSRGQCGQRRVSTPTVAELCLQRSGAQGPKPRRAFDEAGKQHSFQEERCAVFPYFVWRQTTPLFMRTTPRPQARAHRGLRIRPRRMLGCMRSMWASFLMPWPMPMQHAVLCARAWSARELRSCSSPAAKKPGRRHRRRWMHALCMQSCLHAMQCHF